MTDAGLPAPFSTASASTAAPESATPAVAAPGRAPTVLERFWREGSGAAPSRTLVAGGATGVVAAALLVGHPPGLGVALVGPLLWAAAAPMMWRRGAREEMVLAALSVALVAVVAVRDAGWLLAVCVVVAAGAGAVAATSARSGPAVVLSGVVAAAGLVRTLPWLWAGVGRSVGRRRDQLRVVLRSVAVTVVLLGVFGLLFASADTVFATYLPRADVGLLPARVVVSLLVALAAAALAHLATAPPPWAALPVRRRRPARLGEWLLPVVALDALVLAFVGVQVGALLGGNRHVLETAGLTYAQYARSGFAQLVAATALTLLVVAVAARCAPRAAHRDRVLTSAALGVLCLGTLGVVVSALRRIDLYVDAFGLTRLRLLAVVAELTMAAVLVLVVVAGVRWRGTWLPRAVVVVTSVAALGLAAVNPDALILRHNTTAELETPVDVAYLQGLSDDAVPAMAGLPEPLRSCLLEHRAGPARPAAPMAWNLGRSRADAALADVDAVPGSTTSPCYRSSVRYGS